MNTSFEDLSMTNRRLPLCRRWVRALCLGINCALMALTALPAAAAVTDLSDAPLASGVTTQVKPNLLFTLDDSGSMAWGHMPDSLSGWVSYVGYRNYLCNSMYYNPNTTYTPPPRGDGTNLPAQSFTAALNNGYGSSTSSTNLSSTFVAYSSTTGNTGGSSDTSQAAYYYTFTGSGTPTSTQCQQSASSSFPHSSTNFTKVRVTATSGVGSTDERVNFANWWAYYRTRLLMMKGATARAFAGVTSDFRVGFITINPGSPVSSSKYLAIADFGATQRLAWYNMLYAQSAGSGTPLREALSRAGRHYAGKTDGINSGMSGDPVQYSCQQNFTMLTTDGYWNSNDGVQLDGSSAIGNQDGALDANSPRPIFDGSVTTTTVTTTVTTETYSTSGCSGSRRKIIANVDTTVVMTDSAGGSSTSTSSSSSTVVNCTNSPRALQSPNPRTTTSTDVASSGGSSDSLADVAQYYYITDLRTSPSIGSLGLDVSLDNVPAAGSSAESDKASWQHMTTFTMGLGISGTLAYRADYLTATTGDFARLRSGALNWPTAVADDPTALDDLWHAAVNARGQFFSASNPDAVVSSLTEALNGVNARVGAASAAATSNLEPVTGDNFAYTASYTTIEWSGDLQAREINLSTGAIGTTAVWSAQAKLDLMAGDQCDNRTIKLFRSGATNNLTDFSWNTFLCNSSLAPTGSGTTGLNSTEQAYFDSTEVVLLDQYSTMTDGSSGTINQRSLAAGANLVNYLRGQRGFENYVRNTDDYYRGRSHVLGDIVNAQPVYVKAPFGSYSDSGYSTFQSSNASRTPMVYAAGNDGMLHAFYAGTSTTDTLGGQERWAFIPTMALPNLYKLADTSYATNHRYFVDGTPTVSDVYDSTAAAWKTILVGGLNKGGQGYYALDVTDPANPKGLWEFKRGTSCYPTSTTSDCHLGYSFGNPVISKLADGRWVVFVTSGYNNVNSPAITGDGIGYLYVLNAMTGAIIYKISTATGSSTTPSGLGKINNYVINTFTNNTTERLYGVDLLGNIWRFEVNGTQSATLIATAKDALGNPQSITTKPQLADVGSPTSIYVYVATGRYIGATDVQNTQVQSVYGIKDTLTSTTIPDLRASLAVQSYTTSGTNRTIACTTRCTSTAGWMLDLPISGERVNIDMRLELGTLVTASNIPENSPCNIGGYSWLNFFDAATGSKVAGASYAGSKLSDSLAVGLSVVRLPDGRVVVIATPSDARQLTSEAPVSVAQPAGRRISWRELIQ